MCGRCSLQGRHYDSIKLLQREGKQNTLSLSSCKTSHHYSAQAKLQKKTRVFRQLLEHKPVVFSDRKHQ